MRHAEGEYCMVEGLSAFEKGCTVSCACRVSMVRRTWSMVRSAPLSKQEGPGMWRRNCVFGEKLSGGVGDAIVDVERRERGVG